MTASLPDDFDDRLDADDEFVDADFDANAADPSSDDRPEEPPPVRKPSAIDLFLERIHREDPSRRDPDEDVYRGLLLSYPPDHPEASRGRPDWVNAIMARYEQKHGISPDTTSTNATPTVTTPEPAPMSPDPTIHPPTNTTPIDIPIPEPTPMPPDPTDVTPTDAIPEPAPTTDPAASTADPPPKPTGVPDPDIPSGSSFVFAQQPGCSHDLDVTPHHVRANRENARHSTGPKTPEGKAISAKNAVKHGLTSMSLIARDGESQEEIDDIVASLRDELNPDTPFEELAFDAVAKVRVAMLRDDRALALLAAEHDERMRELAATLPARRAATVANLARRFDADPNPLAARAELLDTAEGCAWLLDRIDFTRAVLPTLVAPWSWADAATHVRLLGRDPADLVRTATGWRLARDLVALWRADDPNTPIDSDLVTSFLQHLFGCKLGAPEFGPRRTALLADLPAGPTARASLEAALDAERAALADRRDHLRANPPPDPAIVLVGTLKEYQLYERYRRDHERMYHRAVRAFDDAAPPAAPERDARRRGDGLDELARAADRRNGIETPPDDDDDDFDDDGLSEFGPGTFEPTEADIARILQMSESLRARNEADAARAGGADDAARGARPRPDDPATRRDA